MVRTRPLIVLVLGLCACGSEAFAAKKAGKAKPKKARSSSGAAGGGFGRAATAVSGPTPAQLLKTSIESYESLQKLRSKRDAAEAEELRDDDDAAGGASGTESAKDAALAVSVTKWAITARSAAATEFTDWVPVAILALAVGDSAGDPSDLVPSALGASVKEVVEAGSQSVAALRKVGRETVEYAYEPLDSFEKHVYDGLQGRGDRRANAAATLGIEAGATAAEVKKAHRRLTLELHPDRFIGDEEGAAAAVDQMAAVQEAYAELGGGQGDASGSFYASVGGKARISFSGAVGKSALAPLGKPREAMSAAYEEGGWRTGVIPFADDIVKEFVTRNTMRGKDP